MQDKIPNKDLFYRSLINWYDQNKRILPWRDDPVPYKVWISEIMLQQTRVQTVIPYFNRFMDQMPTIEILANTQQDKLNKLWEGLGYYSRVRNIQKAALQIIQDHNGIVPSTYNDLINLKGIGEYTAGAILSIAYNQKYTAVDGNVLRVFARILAIRDDIKTKENKTKIKKVVSEILPDDRVGDFNQALMEIGATICLPSGKPYCEVCPLKDMCEAYKQGLQNEIPIKRKTKKVPIEKKTVLLIQYDNKYIIEQRESSGLLAGLYQFPNYDGHLTKQDVVKVLKNMDIESIEPLSKSKHIFSHKVWEMIGYRVILKEVPNDYTMFDKKEIKQYYAIPTAFKKYKDLI